MAMGGTKLGACPSGVMPDWIFPDRCGLCADRPQSASTVLLSIVGMPFK